MAQHRRLSDHELIAARWEYEVTAISERALAAKVGLTRPSLKEWIVKQGWTKARVLRRYEGAAGQQQLQHDTRAFIRQADDRKIVHFLAFTAARPPASNPATRASLPPGANRPPGATRPPQCGRP